MDQTLLDASTALIEHLCGWDPEDKRLYFQSANADPATVDLLKDRVTAAKSGPQVGIPDLRIEIDYARGVMYRSRPLENNGYTFEMAYLIDYRGADHKSWIRNSMDWRWEDGRWRITRWALMDQAEYARSDGTKQEAMPQAMVPGEGWRAVT